MIKKTRAKDGERLDFNSVEKALKAFNSTKGTKKEAREAACSVMNIAYNIKRLDRIFEEHEEEKAFKEKRRKQVRGTPFSDSDISLIAQCCLDGDSISYIADVTFRSTEVIKNAIEDYGIPQKQQGTWYDRRFKLTIPDEAVKLSFEVGEIAWSDKYNSVCIVREVKGDVYKVYIVEKIEEPSPYFSIREYGGRYANLPVSDMASLDHLRQYGVDIYKAYREYFPTWLK